MGRRRSCSWIVCSRALRRSGSGSASSDEDHSEPRGKWEALEGSSGFKAPAAARSELDRLTMRRTPVSGFPGGTAQRAIVTGDAGARFAQAF